MRSCPACHASAARPFAEKNTHAIVQCAHCATLYTIDGIERAYDGAYATEYERAPFLAKRLDDIVAAFGPARRNGRLLDVGFGAGDLLDAARRAGWSPSGVELAKPAVEQARRHGIDAFCGTLYDAHYDDHTFDVVIASEILEHVTAVEPLLIEIRRVLRPGGLLWATTPHARGLSARILGASWSVISPPNHVQLFSIRGLRALLQRTGFPSIAIAAEGVNPAEILNFWRGRKTSVGFRMEAAETLNSYFEERPTRRAIKRAVNELLAITRLGDSLKVFAR